MGECVVCKRRIKRDAHASFSKSQDVTKADSTGYDEEPSDISMGYSRRD